MPSSASETRLSVYTAYSKFTFQGNTPASHGSTSPATARANTLSQILGPGRGSKGIASVVSLMRMWSRFRICWNGLTALHRDRPSSVGLAKPISWRNRMMPLEWEIRYSSVWISIGYVETRVMTFDGFMTFIYLVSDTYFSLLTHLFSQRKIPLFIPWLPTVKKEIHPPPFLHFLRQIPVCRKRKT